MKKRNNNFTIFVGLVFLITFILANLAMYFYRSTGSYALDLSRPGYKDVRKEIRRDESEEKINLEGEIDKKFIQKVNQKVDHYQNNISSEEVFSEKSISDKTLGISIND